MGLIINVGDGDSMKVVLDKRPLAHVRQRLGRACT
jgi:hypothetical protein